MATIVKVQFETHSLLLCNISGTVGYGGKNERNDVMLIQAMLRLAEEYDGFSISRWPHIREDVVPKVNGNFFDGKTEMAIWNFQKKWSNRLLGVDGKINPASYKLRTIKDHSTARLMTITLLSLKAWECSELFRHLPLPFGIRSEAPQIHFNGEQDLGKWF